MSEVTAHMADYPEHYLVVKFFKQLLIHLFFVRLLRAGWPAIPMLVKSSGSIWNAWD